MKRFKTIAIAALAAGVAGMAVTAAQADGFKWGKGHHGEGMHGARMGGGMGLAMPLWALSSFFVMLWTLLHVARLPNGGAGPFRTGSDLTQEEQRLKAYETA